MKKTFSKLREEMNIPNLGLTYDREIMPQITDPKAFIEHLRSQSIPFDNRKVDSNTLKATQMNFDMNKVQGLLDAKDVKPVFVSKDNHIMDGHHRWLANYYSGRPTNCCVVDLPILELMRVAKEHVSSLNEELTHKKFKPMMDGFVKYVSDDLGIKNIPSIRFKDVNDDFASFGGYNPSDKSIVIDTKNRHPMDIFRTLAHELIHAKQDEDGKIKDVSKEGETGSEVENEANSRAGIYMRNFGRSNPDMFKHTALVEEGLHQWFKSRSEDGKRGWVQIGGRYEGKPCARQPGQTTTPKCRSSREAARMTKKQKEFAFKQKQLKDPDQKDKKNAAKPTMVATYKETKKMDEEKDACYHKVKARYNVWPSAYASGALVKCRKVGAAKWGKKSVKEATNIDREKQITSIDKEFNKFLEDTSELDTYKREEGTKELADLYKKGTPGQWNEEDKVVSDDIGGPTTLRNPLNEKKKIVRKKRIEEDGVLDTASGAVGLPTSDSIGPEFGVAKSPSLIGGLVGVSSPISGFGPAGSLYPFGTYGISESLSNWANKPETIERFRKKYGKLAEHKLLETVKTINESIEETEQMSKTIKQIRESWEGRAGRDMGTVPYSHAEDKVNEASPAWQRKEGKNPEGGLNRKGVESYRRENPGSKLQTAVTTDPSKLKPGSKKAKRRLSFCRRMKGMKAKLTSAKTARDPDSRINKSLRKWNCE